MTGKMLPWKPRTCACGSHVFCAGRHARTILVSSEDGHLLDKKWTVIEKRKGRYYAAHRMEKKDGKWCVSLKLHQVVSGQKWMDHKNQNAVDNRRENLRQSTQSQQQWNKQKNRTYRGRKPTSVYKGVSKHRNNWIAQIGKDSRQIVLGLFKDEYEAAQAYDRKALELHGEFASINFPASGAIDDNTSCG